MRWLKRILPLEAVTISSLLSSANLEPVGSDSAIPLRNIIPGCFSTWMVSIYHPGRSVRTTRESSVTSSSIIGSKGFSEDEILGSGGGFRKVYRVVLPSDEMLNPCVPLCKGLKSIKDREVCCFMISCKNLTNIDSVIDWLVKHSKSKN